MKFNRMLTQAFMLALAVTGCVPAPAIAQTAENPPGFVQRQGADIITQNLVPTGAATAGSAIEIVTNGASALGVEVTGTYTGALSLQGTIGGVTWETVGGTPFTKRSSPTSPSATIASGATGNYIVNVAGYYKVRITGLAAMTGAAKVNVIGSVSDGASIAAGSGGSSGGLTDTELRATPVPVSGTVAVTGVATSAKQDTQITAEQATQASVASLDTKATTAQTSRANIESYTSRLLSSAGPATPGAAAATTSFIVGARFNTTPATRTNGQEGSLEVDQNGNLRAIQPDAKAIAADTCASACTNRNYFAVDMSGYESLRFHLSALAGTVTVQTSEDSTTGSDGTWVSASCLITSAASASAVMTTTPSAGGWVCPKYLRWLRLAQTSYSSGTTTTLGGHMSKTPFFGHVTLGNSSVAIIGNNSENSAPVLSPVPISVEIRSTNKTAGTSGNTMRPVATLVGVPIQRPWSIPELELTGAAGSGGVSNSTADQTLASAGAAGIRNYLTQFDLMCEALGTASEITIRDGSGGTVLWRTKVGTGGQPLVSVSFPNPKKTTAATALIWKMETASGTGACYGNGSVFQAP